MTTLIFYTAMKLGGRGTDFIDCLVGRQTYTLYYNIREIHFSIRRTCEYFFREEIFS